MKSIAFFILVLSLSLSSPISANHWATTNINYYDDHGGTFAKACPSLCADWLQTLSGSNGQWIDGYDVGDTIPTGGYIETGASRPLDILHCRCGGTGGAMGDSESKKKKAVRGALKQKLPPKPSAR